MLTFVSKVMFLLCNLSRFVSCPSKEQVSFNFMSIITIYSYFRDPQNKICHCPTFSPSICMK